MRAGADAGIFAVAPIDEIVPALGAGPRVVGDFVGGHAVRLGDLLRRVEQRAGEILVGRLQLAGPPQALEHRVGLDGELVEREMLAGQRRAPAPSSARQAASLWPGRA